MTKAFRFAIAGPGRISQSFAKSLALMPEATLHAVGSRSLERATKFANNFQAPFPNVKCYGSYEEMAQDPEIDAVYIGTLHHQHAPASMVFLEAGKPVLCEKAFTLNQKEAQTLVNKAREKNVFLMEAIWTRFLPATKLLLEVLQSGLIGEVRSVKADFGIVQKAEGDRWLNPAMAGGALLDLGIYNLYFTYLTMGGWPEKVHSSAHIGKTGVDEEGHYFLDYGQGRAAHLSCSVGVSMDHDAVIHGTKGSIRVPNFFHAEYFTVYIKDQEPKRYDAPHDKPGYIYEAREVIRCVRAGLIESPELPHETSLKLMGLMDSLRAQWGLKYPGE